jgi:CRP/FNR family transcriptional regulator, cyclic AMP receptor protein
MPERPALAKLIYDGGATPPANTPAAPPRQIGREAVPMLAEIPLFSSLSRRHLGRVASVASTKRYAQHATLAVVGKPADAFFVLLDGRVRVEVPGGRKVELGAGDFFGEMALIDGEPRSATVVAVSDVYVMTIARAKFLKLLESEPKIALAILATLTRRLRDVQAAASL